MTIERSGDWALAQRLLAGGAAKLEASIHRALSEEAQLLRKEIVTGITSQAPGGEELKGPSPLTLAARRLAGFRGTRALLVRADLRNAVGAIVRGDEAFVGVPRRARSADGTATVDVAQVQEFGAGPFVIPLTPRMRRYLFALFKESGEEREPNSERGRGLVVVTIPARPFLRPAFRKYSRGARQRFLERVARHLGWGRGVS